MFASQAQPQTPTPFSDVDFAALALPVAPPETPTFSGAIARTPDSEPAVIESDKVIDIVGRTYDHFCNNRPDPSAFPQTAMEILRLLDEKNTSLSHISAAIRKDPAIAAHILRLANSSAFRASSPVDRLDLAILRIGVREVSLVSAGVASRTLFDGKTKKEYARYADAFNTLYRNSTTMAFASSWLALLTQKARPEKAFMASLLCDIGASLALRSMCQVLGNERLTEDEVTRVVFLVHSMIGAEALLSFEVPDFLVRVCRDHHAPVLGSNVPEEMHLVRVVQGAMEWTSNPGASLATATHSAQALGLDKETLDSVPEAITSSTERSSALVM